jgi:integrase/recombinase XerC/integrase/recombinase XerD
MAHTLLRDPALSSGRGSIGFQAAWPLCVAWAIARRSTDSDTDASAHTIRAYRGDLLQFAAHHDAGPGELTVTPVRAFLAGNAELAPATRKRKRAAVASFCRWAIRHDLLDANPMDRIDTVKVPKRLPRPAAADDVAKVLAAICPRRPRRDLPLDRLRDRVLFETIYVCGARAGEVCGLYVEDLDLRTDDEHVRIHGKGGTVRTVLLDDRGYVALLKLYLQRTGYQNGPLFRASINGSGSPLSYDAAQHRWTRYCATTGVGVPVRNVSPAANGGELLRGGSCRGQLGAGAAGGAQFA